jgi:hypothetical protein
MLRYKLQMHHWADSAILIKRPHQGSALIDQTDYLCLVITEEPPKKSVVQYYLGTFLVQEHYLTMEDLRQWIINGEERRILSWLMYGELLFDRSFSLKHLIQQLNCFPSHIRKIRVCAEFSYFLRCYKQAKDDLSHGQVLDAFHHVMSLLNHWARTIILKSGHYPELTVWEQIKDINTGVYRMYEELVSNSESVEKRLELILLGAEFTIISNIRENAQFILELMTQGEKKVWTYHDLITQPEVRKYRIDIPVLLEKLTQKQIIERTIWMSKENDGNAYYAYIFAGEEVV